MLSLAAELAGIGLLIVAPLVWGQRLPAFSFTKIAVWRPLAPTPTPVPVRATHGSVLTKPSPFPRANVMLDPPRIPDRLIAFTDPPPLPTGNEVFVSGPADSVGVSAVGNTPGPPATVRHSVEPTTPAPTIRIRVSRLEPAKIVYQVMPVYPPLARSTRTSGTVSLIGVIATNGTIQSLRVLKGHPLLVRAALDAVRQWRYQPTILNGQPVEVEAPIDVTFTLQ